MCALALKDKGAMPRPLKQKAQHKLPNRMPAISLAFFYTNLIDLLRPNV
jgi:hypothetical protein